MLRFSSFIFFLSLLVTVFSIILKNGGSGFDFSSESRESYSGRGRSRGHHHHHHRPSYGGGSYNNGDDDDNNYPPPRPPRPPPSPTCDEGWKFFQRPSGGWCMRVFPGTMDRDASEVACSTHGAVLSGLQNVAEINYIVSAALPVIAPEVSGGVWIGTRRRAECIGSGQTAACTKTNTFYWTDNSATGIEGMIFQMNEPNNGNTPNGNQNCALLTVAHTPTITAVSIYWSGQMDDITCGTSAASHWPGGTLPRANRAYVCGKAAH